MPPPQANGSLVHNSDRGVQYAYREHRALRGAHGIACSMRGEGDCYDSAAAESVFETLTAELDYREHYRTREEAMRSIHGHVACWYS